MCRVKPTFFVGLICVEDPAILVFILDTAGQPEVFQVGDRFEKRQPGLECIEVWPEGLEHRFPGIGLTLADQLGHVQEASVVVQQNLASAFIALVDQSAVRRIGDSNIQPDQFLKGAQIVAKGVGEIGVPHDDR